MIGVPAIEQTLVAPDRSLDRRGNSFGGDVLGRSAWWVHGPIIRAMQPKRIFRRFVAGDVVPDLDPFGKRS